MSGGWLAGIEAGGTKFVCGVGRGPTEIAYTISIPTRSPEETLADVIGFIQDVQVRRGPMRAVGVASFGPIDLDPNSAGCGRLVGTPKPGWSGFDLKGTLARAIGCPVAIDTDVAGAGLAEVAFGAGQGLDCVAYLTIGTGIGGALIVGGRPLHTSRHPEMGHIPVRRRPEDAGFNGTCPYHHDCVEGLASGPSVIARTGANLSELPMDSPVWSVLSDYLAQLCRSVLLIGTPQRIILGGGVMSNPSLYALIQQAFWTQCNGYIHQYIDRAAVAQLIVPPGLGDRAGLTGAMLLAQEADRIARAAR